MISQSSSADAASLAIDSGATRSDAGAVCTRTLGAGGTRKHSATVETATSIFNEANRTKDLLDHMELANMSGRRKRGTHDSNDVGCSSGEPHERRRSGSPPKSMRAIAAQ